MRRILAATVASAIGLVLTAGVSSGAAQATGRGSSGYTPPPISWGICENPVLASRGAECGFVEVPLDYSKPDGTKIKLAISRIKAKSPAADYQGVMLTNPGGPGGSGLIWAVLGEFVPDGVGEDYDWIGFDPRGVGSSEPSLTCDTEYFGYNRPYFVPVTGSLEKTWLARTNAYAEACDRAGGPLLDHLKTTDTVADMESIRKALAAEQINFYGFSYGTYLGQVYATQHPDKVRRMVLDGNVDPSRVWYEANLDQDVQFDKNIEVFFAWVAKYDSVYHLGASADAVKAKYYDTLEKLRTAPAAGKIGPTEWNDIFLSAAYYVFGWEDTAATFAAWVNEGDTEPLLARYAPPGAPGADNGYAIYLGVQCTDVQWPTSWSTWQQDNWRIHTEHPFSTWNNAWYNAPCVSWGAKAGTPVQVNGSKAPPILLISETHDAATPFTGSLEVRKRFPNSALVEGYGGTTHAGSLNGAECIDNTVAAYLATGALPQRLDGNQSDKRCHPIPQPNPTGEPAPPSTTSITRAELQELIGR
ncbi:alpha/beta hydrolase [Phytohabitans flavus]|uniref:Peptidase n=1 Tax=Phytohabitans flavus TaxID=1076124 RepID=A0A6F8XLH9_9ACTN|nr:alpha/beta hydrolase [Phytohabitans flavus]BCB74665.1 peptidase [Phytohabitans flavus]